jgi:signal transduction histidine kinase
LDKFTRFLAALPEAPDNVWHGRICRLLEEAQDVGIAVFCDMLVCRFTTPVFSRLVGLAQEEIVGKPLLSLFPSIDEQVLTSADAARMRTEYAAEPVLTMLPRRGNAPGVLAKATSVWQNGNLVGVLVAASRFDPEADDLPAFDSRELSLMEVMSILSDDPRVNRLYRLIGPPILLLDAFGALLFASDRARRLFGVAKEAELPFYNIIADPNFQRAEVGSLIGGALQGEEVHLPPLEYYTELEGALGVGSGQKHTLKISLIPTEDIGGTQSVFMLVTQHGMPLEHLEPVALMQRSESVAMLARGVAHEFNNVFAAIKGITSMLETESETDSEAGVYLQKMDQLVDRGVKLITDLTNYAMVSQLKLTPHRAAVFFESFKSLVDFVIPRDVKCEFSISVDGEINADANSLRQALFNLIHNALEAVADSERREIHLTVDEVPPGSVELDMLRFATPAVLRIQVADSGPGIPQGISTRIFEPYFTTRGSTSSSGLGLNVAQQIVRRHGGVILAERSGPLGGALFTVYLPLHKPR